MRVYWLAAVSMAAFTMVASAQNVDIIKQRQKIYKSFGESTKPVAAMMKGKAAFDLAAVKTALGKYVDGTKQLPGLFPDDSKTGADTEALPALWTHKEDFEARLKKLGADSSGALAAITDEASFTANFPAIAKQCGACHKLYREKKDKDKDKE